jgi:hypothetical protein
MKKNLYIVHRKSAVGYDEFDSFVVIAPSEDEAKNLAQSYADENEGRWAKGEFSGGRAELITDFSESRVLHSSFNAG